MHNYTCKVSIVAPPGAVYGALTTPEGLAGWLTNDCEVRQGVGERSTFRFGPTFCVMKVTKLIPNQEVRWECVEQHHHAPSQIRRTDEWVGTEVVFHLSTRTNGETELSFMHQGLVPTLECYGICQNDWNHLLKLSLKQYVETGFGQPYGRAAQ